MKNNRIVILVLFCTIHTILAQHVSVNTDSILLCNTQFRNIGPFRGGRSCAVCGSLDQKNTFYFGATGGGIWKTTDGGSNWKNISDGYFGGSIGAIAIAPSKQKIIYVGEGEATLRGNVSEGFGMWKSTDAGNSWKNIGLKDSRHISRIVIHPDNPDIVWVAALGHLFGENKERGVYKTTDGGVTWKQVLFNGTNSGAFDLVINPINPSILYASTWAVKRTPWSFESGGSGSALWKSTDGGDTWNKLNDKKGFPGKTILGIIGIAIAPTNANLIYAMVESEKGGLYKSTDAGNSWELINAKSDLRQRAWYYSKVFVDPNNQNAVYVLNVEFHKSTDGGANFNTISTPHGDHHDLWIDPKDPNRIILADDGGAQISFDGGSNWSTYYNQPTSQFYRVSTDNHFPYRVLGAQQDNSTVRILSRSTGGGISSRNWTSTAGFESGYVVADPTNPDIVYGGNYGGYLSRYDHKTDENRSISVWPVSPIGNGADVLKYRFQWNFPIFFSPHNPKKLYAAGNILFATTNEGASWEELSPDLTTNDKKLQGPSGGPITKDNTSVETYCTIFTGAESPLEVDLLWIGTDDGLIQLSKDGGKKWENVTPPAAGEKMLWNCVEIDPFKKGCAYFAGTKYKSDDFKPYIFKTEDYGKTWKLLTKGIQPTHFTRCIRADKKQPGLLYAGTEYGLYISSNGGESWNQQQLGLPIVPITDMTIKDNDLVVATQGRSFWILDDLNPIQLLAQKNASSLLKENIFAFPIKDLYLFEGYKQEGENKTIGENPYSGLVVKYYLKESTDSIQLKLRILDENGALIKSFSNKTGTDSEKLSVEVGMNQFIWDLKYPAAEKSEGFVLWNGGIDAPTAPPGKYSFQIVLNNKDSLMVPFQIRSNPTYQCSDEDYKNKFKFLLEVKDKFSEVQKTIKNIREIRTQINSFKDLHSKDVSVTLKTDMDSLLAKMARIENVLYQTKATSGQDLLNYPIRINDQLSGIYHYAESGNAAPTAQAKLAFDELSILANNQITEFKRLLETELKLINQKIKETAINIIWIQE